MNKKTFKKARYFTLFILFTVLNLTIIYNSCSPQSVEDIKFSKILSSFLQDFRVEIKNGSYSTKTLNDIPVNFKVPTKNLKSEAIEYEMKISQTPNCSGGEWEPYQKETTWTFQSDKEEKLLFIYVKFREKRAKEVNYIFDTRDFEEIQGESKCIYDSIVYDTKPPENLNLSYKPAEKTNQKNAEFRFNAKDYSPIHFQCQLNTPGGSTDPQTNSEETLWTSCASGITYDSSSLTEEGEYTFSLRAIDLSGNTSEILEYPWTIDSTAPSLSFICPNDTDSRNKPDSISVASANLDFPVSLYCKNDQEQFESCGTIGSSQATTDIDSTYFIEESLPSANNYYKKTLNIKALDPSGNFSEPIECVWYVDTESPTIRLTGQVPLFSYGTSTDPYIYPNPFKIEIHDNSLQVDHTQSDAIEIKVSKGSQTLPISTEITSEGNPLELEFHITQGLKPGINNPNINSIEIQVKDKVGNISNTLPATLDVYGQVEESFSTQSISTTSKSKADILFVLDDSGSMDSIARHLGNSFLGIINSLSTLDWQIAASSIKEGQNFGKLVQLIQPANSQGQLASFLANRYILSSKQTSCEPPLYCSPDTNTVEAIFKRTITKIDGEVNNFTFLGNGEYGIKSVNTLLNKYNQAKTLPTSATFTPLQIAMNSFLRSDSTFVVIFITDEKNCGYGTGIRNCHSNSRNHINHPQSLIDKVKTIFRDDKKFISYPIIPEPGEGHPYNPDPYIGYPKENNDDYLKLAKATQGRGDKSHLTNPVIWVDVDHSTNRTSRSNSPGCSTSTTPGSTTSTGIYTSDLCTISDDILKITTRTIQLNCPPVTEDLENTIGIHPPKYFYSSDPNANLNADLNDPTLFTPLNTGTTIENVAITISESWTNSSSTDTNRVTLEVQSGDTLPEGTYIVDYFCYSDQILPPTNTN